MPDIRCPRCGHSWPIHVSQVGQAVVCPQCGGPSVAVGSPAPLSLDEAEQLPPLAGAAPRGLKPAGRKRLPTAVLAVVSLAVTAVLMVGVWYGFQRGSGSFADSTFEPLTLGEYDCDLTMPPGFTRGGFTPEGYAMTAGERFEKSSDWRGVHLRLDCVRLDPTLAPNTTVEQIAFGQRDRRVAELKAAKVRESSLQLYAAGKAVDGLEYQLELPDKSTCVERVYARTTGDRPTAWVLSVRGPKVTPTTPWVLRWFNSFLPTRRPAG